MSDKLLLHPNQRIDKVDLDYAASGYTDAVIAQDHREVLQGSSTQALHGFRIELGTQPGEVTVHNGAYIDSSGKLVTNEESLDASQTVFLLGANSTFYLEITFEESPTTLDDKAFWDPTFDNGAGTLKGKEYVQEVNTRTSTIWKIKSPISNSGFTASNDNNSRNVPLAILNTDSLGNITASVNPGLVTAPYSTVLEEDAAAGDTLLKVIDSVLLLNQITVGTETKTVDYADWELGFVTLTTGLASAKPRGTIIQNVGGPQYIVPRTTAHVEYVDTFSTHPDKLKRFFAGDESRGESLIASPFTAGQRTDLQLETVKDHVDFLAHQLREMKVGSSAPFPSNIGTIRYYDYAGSIQGSKTVTFTIGTGVGASVGDFNGTTEVPFQQAIATAVASGLSSVVIFVKNGTYTISTPIASSIPVTIVGESTSGSDLNVILAGGSVTTAMFSPTTAINLYNVYLTKTTASATGVIDLKEGDTRVGLFNVKSALFTPLVSAIAVDGEYFLTLDVDQCYFSSNGTVAAIMSFGPTSDEGTLSGVLKNSIIEVRGSTTHFTNFTRVSTFNVEGINFSSFANGSFIASDATDLHIYTSKFFFLAANATGGVLRAPATGGLQRSSVSDCEVLYSSAGTGAKAFYVVYAIDSSIRNNVITMTYNAANTGAGVAGIEVSGSNSICSNFTVDNNAINLGIGKTGACISIHNCTPSKITVKGCALSGGNAGVYIYALTSVSTEFGRTSISIDANTYRGGNYEVGAAFTTEQFGVYVTELPEVIDLNINSNNIVGLRGSSRAVGIYVRNQATTASTVRSKVNIQFNGIKQIGRPTADEADQAYGVQIGELTALTDVRVTGNQVDSVYGTEVAGIHNFSSGANICENAFILDNSISNVICYSAAAGHAAGIVTVGFTSTAEISNNIVTSISDAAATSTIEGIQLGAVGRATLQGNQLINCISNASGGAFDNEFGISVTNSSCSVENNRIIGTFNGVKYLFNNAVQVSGVSICGNVVGPSATRAPRVGIAVTITAGASMLSSNINDNIITNLAALTIAHGVIVTAPTDHASSGLSISNNVIKETGGANPGSAIFVTGVDRLLINSNSLHGSATGHSGIGLTVDRAGIRLESVNEAVVNSNMSYWNINFTTGTGFANQGEFRVAGSSMRYNLVGNYMLGSNLGTAYLAISIAGAFFGLNAMSNFISGTEENIAEQHTPIGGSIGGVNVPAAVNFIFHF